MKILLGIDGMHPRNGGPPVVVAGSAVALGQRGHSVTILSEELPEDIETVTAHWAQLQAAGVSLKFCPPQRAFKLFGFASQDSSIEQAVAASDVVHLHGFWSPFAILTGRSAQRYGKPYFISSHGVFDHRAMTRIRHKWLKKRIALRVFGMYRLIDNAASVIFGSQAEAEQSWMPSQRMRICCVPNGADRELGTIAPTPLEIGRLHSALPEVAAWERIILCRSRIHEEKGIDLLVQAFNRVAPEHPGLGLLIAGLRQDEAYQERIEALIASGPVADRITLTTDFTGSSNQFLYQISTIFAMPSLAEGFSMGLIEGLANGRPMLITQFCHMPVVANSGAGIVVDSTVESLEAGLRAILDDSTDLAAMGSNARALFEKNFTWAHVAGLLESNYAGSIGSGAGI